MTRILAALILCLPFLACGARPIDPAPVILSTLQGGVTLSHVVADQTLASGAWEACVVAVSTESLLTAVIDVLDGDLTIPAVAVNVAPCLALNPEFVPGDVNEDSVQRTLQATMTVLTTVNAMLTLWESDICKTAPALFTVLLYLEVSTPEILSEILAPDGQLFLPEIQVSPGICE